MAKSKKAAAGKLAGKTVAFVGKFGYKNCDLKFCTEIAESEGGTVVDGEKTVPDYLVAGAGVGGNPPAVVAKIQKKNPQVQTLDLSDFYQLTAPTMEDFLAILRSGPKDWEYWASSIEGFRAKSISREPTSADTNFRDVFCTRRY
jgi:hypothetical protein